MRLAALLTAVAAGLAVPATGQHQQLAMLNQIEVGQWELRLRDSNGGIEHICIHDGWRLIQLRHSAANCDRLIIDDAASEITVQYTCHGHGYGRTRIRRETGRLVQIETQGIVDGLPFDFAAEGRRVGDCTV